MSNLSRCLAIVLVAQSLAIGRVGTTRAAAADDPKPLEPIKLTIHLPADAELEVTGRKVDGSGELRQESINPTKETETLYVVKATWMEGDVKRATKKSLRLKPGMDADVDLNLELNPDEKMILTLINKEREMAGASPLSPDHKLNRAARTHSINMAKQNTMSHDLDGKGPPHRMKEAGYQLRSFGENVGVGARTPAAAVQMWLNSPPHKENILNRDFTETGLGIAAGKNGRKYYTQVFAIPADK